MKKKLGFLGVFLALALSVGCSSSTTNSSETQQMTSSSTQPTKTIKLGIVGAVYEELWAPAKQKLAQQGIDLEFVNFSSYVKPNNALANGEIDLNAFQHDIYLQTEITQHNYKIQKIGNTFIIPLNLYSNKYKNISELPEKAKIAIPNDPTNGGRALKVLEAAGLIKLSADAGFNPTIKDVQENKKNIEIVELAANTIASALPDIDAGIVNGNYALDFGLDAQNPLFKDNVLDGKEYWNLVAARTEDLSDPAKVELYKKVLEAFQSAETEEVFNNKFSGYFVKIGWDEKLLG